MYFEGGAEVAEVVPGCVRGDKAPCHQLAGVIVLGEDQRLFLPSRPPLVDGAIVLPELADLRALPAPSRAQTGLGPRRRLGEVSRDITGHSRTRTLKAQARSQLIGDQGVIERLAVG